MENSLTIFEGQKLEILTKEDVNIEFNGEVLFNGLQVCTILEYINQNRDIDRHCEEEDVYLITKDKLSTKMVSSLELNTNILTIGQRGTKFINEDGVFDLIYNSKMSKAKKFKRKVKEIVKKVQQTGRYDSIENKIQQIEDDRERELSLKLYQLQNILKISPNDMITAISYRQTEQELKQYKQDKKIKEQEEQLKLQNKKLEEQEKKLDNMFVIGDRVQFVNEVNRIARATGKQQSDIYSAAYKELKSMYGVDLSARVRNKREEIQNKRLELGKKAYSPATLKSKVNNLVIADELNIWNELGRSLNSVNNELLVG